MRISTCFLLIIAAVKLASSSENIALNKPTMESDTGYGAAYSSLANDGGYNPNFYQGTCTYTTAADSRPYAWWMVDLGNVYRITHVVVARCNSGYLNDLHFEMYMGVPLICSHKPALCRYVSSEFSRPTQNVTCEDDTAVGRYLMVRHSSPTTEIVLCEVEVYGELVPKAVQATGKCSGPVWLNRRADHGLVGDDVITRNATSKVSCAAECFSTGECAAFSFNKERSTCKFAAAFVQAFVKASAGWVAYDFC